MIAIIDDGVHENYFRHCIVEDLEVYPDFIIQKRKSPFCDSISHGTACAAIIQHFAPAAEIISIKILNSETGKCKPEELIAALHWCASHHIKQCNLSLGSVACKDFDMIYEQVQQISNSGMLIIAAQNNSGKFTLPANLSGVIGVKLLETLPENTIQITERTVTGMNLSANIDLTVINDTNIPPKTLVKSNSYITAALSGLIYRSGYTFGEPKEALYTKLKSSAPASFNIRLGDMLEESKNNTLEIPVIQVAIAGTEGQRLCLKLSRLFREDGSNAVSLTEQPVSHLETETYNPCDSMQINRVYAQYNANIILIQTESQHLTPDIIISKDEHLISVLDISEQIIHSLPIGNEMDEELISRTYKLLYSLFEIEQLG